MAVGAAVVSPHALAAGVGVGRQNVDIQKGAKLCLNKYIHIVLDDHTWQSQLKSSFFMPRLNRSTRWPKGRRVAVLLLLGS